MKKFIFNKKLNTLFKQANDLSVLCDVETSLVVFNPEENNVYACPSLAQANDIVKNYLTNIKNQNPGKMVRHDDYLEKIADAQESRVYEREQMAEVKEMENLFKQLVYARKEFDELDVRETKSLLKLFAGKRTKLEERLKQLNENVEDEINGDENDGQH